MISNHAVDRSARSVRRVWILIGLGLLTIIAIWPVSFYLRVNLQLGEIRYLDHAAHVIGGEAYVPQGSVGVFEWEVEAVLDLHDTMIDDDAFARLASMPA